MQWLRFLIISAWAQGQSTESQPAGTRKPSNAFSRTQNYKRNRPYFFAMTQCIFCKIVEGKLPAQKVAESKNFLAFLDIAPSSRGEVLIVPKKHSSNFLDLPEYYGNEFVEFTQRVANALVAALHADGFNILLNNGAAAGQAIFHTHFHIVPRKEHDGMHASLAEHKQASSADLEAVQKAIMSHLQ